MTLLVPVELAIHLPRLATACTLYLHKVSILLLVYFFFLFCFLQVKVQLGNLQQPRLLGRPLDIKALSGSMLSRRLATTSNPAFTRPFTNLTSRHLSTNNKMSDSKLLIYLMRRDLRVSDNPIFHTLSTQSDHGFTHLLPVYVFAAQQVEVSGFIEGEEKSPYPEARSNVAGFWRCGPHRAKYLAESVWDLKEGLEKVGSGLCIRAGMVGPIIDGLLKDIKEVKVGAVWMTGEEGVEEKGEERQIKQACENAELDCKIWVDEKYLIDE